MAGCYDRNWRVGSKAGGTRSQFRLQSLLPFKNTYPAYLTDVMDVGQSSQTGFRRPGLVSPIEANRTLTVREYEQTIDQLKKENFDLKLRLYLVTKKLEQEENVTLTNEEVDSTVQVVVEFKVETEALRNELSHKNKLLQDALYQAEKATTDLKELQTKYEQLQSELSTETETPLKQAFILIQDENASLLKETEHLSNLLSEKSKDIEEANDKIKELLQKNEEIELKSKKKSTTIQGFIQKYQKLSEMVPQQLRPIIHSAIKAARSNNEENLIIALENLKTSLCKLNPTSAEEKDKGLELKSKEETNSERTSTTEEFPEAAKYEASLEENTHLQNDFPSDSKFMQDIAEYPCTLLSTVTSNSAKKICRQKSDSKLSDCRKKLFSPESEKQMSEVSDILKENESLKCSINEKLKTIDSLSTTCKELEQRTVELQSELDEALSKAKQLDKDSIKEKNEVLDSSLKTDCFTQTSLQWHVMDSKVSDNFIQNAGHSNNIDILKEEVLMLLLVIEQKDKELSVAKQDLTSLPSHLENASNKKDHSINVDNMEINELHERLALSCSVNNELMKHLHDLEIFMENLLRQKSFDTSSLENISESSDFLSRVSRCLDESLKLSNVLSDHLSICEGSKVFGVDETSVDRDLSMSDRKSYHHMDLSRFSLTAPDASSKSIEGRDDFLCGAQDLYKNVAGTGKRRWSLSSQHKAAKDNTLVDSDNMVVLGTSNNEDLILLLNEHGDPEDVLIRNNQCQPDQYPFPLYSGDQLRRRCWEDMPTINNFWAGEKSSFNPCVTNLQRRNGNQVGTLQYMSSDSDIWSEPDRDVSMQRIGIDVKSSPVASRSPRKSRFKESRTSEEHSSEKRESSCGAAKIQSWSRRRRSSEISKTPCKKCSTQPHLLDCLVRDERDKNEALQNLIDEMYNKNDALQKLVDEISSKNEFLRKELEDLRVALKGERNLKDTLSAGNEELSNHINKLKEELSDVSGKKQLLVSENTQCQSKLTEMSSSNENMKGIVKVLEVKVSDTDALCNQLKTELKYAKEKLLQLDAKCSNYEEQLSASLKVREEYTNRLQNVEIEKDKLLQKNAELGSKKNNIEIEKDKLSKLCEELVSEKNSIKIEMDELHRKSGEWFSAKNELIQKLQKEAEITQSLEKEKSKLNDKLAVSYKEITSLHAINKELQDMKAELLKEKELVRTELISSNSLCDRLKEDLKNMQVSLKEFDSKCASYEEKLNLSSEIKQNFVEMLIKLKGEFTYNSEKLIEIFKVHLGTMKENVGDKLNLSGLSDLDNEERIEKLYEGIVSENFCFQQMIESLHKHLKKIISALQESRSVEENYKNRISSIQKQMESKEGEVNYLKNEKAVFQRNVKELEQTIAERNKSSELLNAKIESFEEKLLALQQQIDKDNLQLNFKDDEITKLQERIFNLHTQINTLISEKTHSDRSIPLSSRVDFLKDSSTSPLSLSSLQSAEKPLKESLVIETGNQTDPISPKSVSLETSPESQTVTANRSVSERYIQKFQFLKAKLLMSEQRVEILEKEKSYLRDELLAEVHREKRTSGSTEEKGILKQNIKDLESKLEAKSSFIRELKDELYGTCEKLVSKQQEVDDVRRKFSQYVSEHKLEAAFKNTLSHRFSDPIRQSNESIVRELKSQKWELIQSILNLQEEVYEKKGIHLGHFEKFKNHIENLHSLEASPSLLKTESEPLLNSTIAKINYAAASSDRSLRKYMVDLELDIECLQNLKIFFKRFFPLPLQSCQPASKSPGDDDSNAFAGQITVVNEKDSAFQSKFTFASERMFKHECLNFEEIIFKGPSGSIETGQNSVLTENNKLVKTSWDISQKLDLMEKAFMSVKSEFIHINNFEHGVVDTPKKTAAMSLLLKIADQVSLLEERANEIFLLNSTLKSSDLFASIPKSFSKQDISDRESLMSDETITLSRSESLSPVSFEEHLPLKADTDDKSRRELFKKSFQGKTDEDKENSREFYPHKSTTVGSSQDSVFHRSHYSSPDLGIESDPNHESSAPEQMEKEDFCEQDNKVPKRHENVTKTKQKTAVKIQAKTVHTYIESDNRMKDDDPSFTIEGTLHAIGILREYELLKREVQESLVGIKSVLSRTGDGLHHIAKHTSPRKTLEYSTFKAIRDTCGNIEVCLKEAYRLVNNFWIAPCPSVQELNMLVQQNQERLEKLKRLKASMTKQENDFREAMEKLKHAEQMKETMEKKISRRLVKTKKIIRQAELKLLENKSQNLPPIPKYPAEKPSCQKTS